MRHTIHIIQYNTYDHSSSWWVLIDGGDSINTSRPLDRRVYTFFVILHDGKLGVGWCLIKFREVTVKKNSMKYFCVIKEKIAYMECVIQKSMLYSYYLFLFILLCDVDSALVSDSNPYIWISNCIQNVRILNGGVFCAERDVTQESSREQTRHSVIVGVGGGAGAGLSGWKKAILVWRNYWITPGVFRTQSKI